MKRIVRLTQAAVVLAATFAPGCGPGRPVASVAPAQPPAKRLELVVFSSNRSGPWRIWIVGEDGSNPRQLTRAGEDEHDVDPAFGPRAERILFTSTRGRKAGIWSMQIDGSDAKRICDGDQAEWSPDGRKIVFRRDGKILTRDLASGAEKIVSPTGWTACSGPSWSPDGRTIALATTRGGRNAIFLVGADGAGKATKVYDQQGACEPHWSPDGKRIVYETETHICTVRPDGTDNRLITYYGGVQRYGRWSPDGGHIVFCQGTSPRGPWELYVVPSGGGEPRRLTEGGSDMYPDWK